MRTVYKKPEILNQASESLPWTFASQANWTKRYTIWHTKTSTATRTTRKVMDRQERRSWSFSVPGMVYVLFWFIGFLLLLFLLLFACLLTLFSSISWGGECSRDEGGSGDREANRIGMHDVKPQSFNKNVFKKRLFRTLLTPTRFSRTLTTPTIGVCSLVGTCNRASLWASDTDMISRYPYSLGKSKTKFIIASKTISHNSYCLPQPLATKRYWSFSMLNSQDNQLMTLDLPIFQSYLKHYMK